jgi:hypothetical protein
MGGSGRGVPGKIVNSSSKGREEKGDELRRNLAQ